MPTAQTLRVRSESVGGSATRANEDRVFASDRAVVLLDGATGSAAPRTGGWYANQLGCTVVQHLDQDPDASLEDVLSRSISEVVKRFNLEPTSSPSSTISIVRVRDDMLDVLVLGDSPVVLQMSDMLIVPIADHRINGVAGPERERLRASREGKADAARRALTQAEAASRNMPGGYWIAETDPTAARHALALTVPLGSVKAALLASDGVAVGVERYLVPESWGSALDIASRSPADLIDRVFEVERSDLERTRWARSKVHDDKTAAYVDLTSIG